MYICVGENVNYSRGVGRGKTLQDAISDWCGEKDIFDYMREYQKWKPLIIEGEEKQIDVEIIVKITSPE